MIHVGPFFSHMYFPQHTLNFRPLPHEQESFLPGPGISAAHVFFKPPPAQANSNSPFAPWHRQRPFCSFRRNNPVGPRLPHRRALGFAGSLHGKVSDTRSFGMLPGETVSFRKISIKPDGSICSPRNPSLRFRAYTLHRYRSRMDRHPRFVQARAFWSRKTGERTIPVKPETGMQQFFEKPFRNHRFPSLYHASNTSHRKRPYCSGVIRNFAGLSVSWARKSMVGMN